MSRRKGSKQNKPNKASYKLLFLIDYMAWY